MEPITAYFLNLLEVVEKELALFKAAAAKTVFGLGAFIAGLFLLGVGFLLFVWTCFTALSLLFGPVWAGLAASVLILLVGGIFLWISKKNLN